ncbi:phage lysis protein [Bifidobacterium goeldii]|uniref:Phage lysis protein n=1 Tax=Bifidobacterium goeldii TaxID=2306975 RepID=A0A430FM76_9BIFI|nr:phage holin [Bifidobacterium goeldii]RSX53927.1 phage lysis protein [Bifidobacterium goeldii]
MADHANIVNTTTPGLNTERVKSIVLLLVQLFSVVQTGLSIGGISQLPFTTDQVSTAITGVIAVATSIWAWWRNNSITEAGYSGKQLTNGIKNGALEQVQGVSMMPTTVTQITPAVIEKYTTDAAKTDEKDADNA